MFALSPSLGISLADILFSDDLGNWVMTWAVKPYAGVYKILVWLNSYSFWRVAGNVCAVAGLLKTRSSML